MKSHPTKVLFIMLITLLTVMINGCIRAPEVTIPTEQTAPPTAKAEPIRVSILFFNDLHGYLEPFTIKEGETKVEVGGIARLAALIKRFEAENRQRNIPTIVVIAGDILQGTPMSTVFQGQPDIECFNVMGVDAITVGNHEFDFGLDAFSRLKEQAKFPFLSANIVYKDTGALLCQPAASFKVSPEITLSIIGVTTEQLLTTTKPANVASLNVLDPDLAIDPIYAELAEQGPVLLLSHCSAASDDFIARTYPGLAAIIGGHDHLLLNPRKLAGTVPIFQTFEKGRYLGRLELEIDPVTKKAAEELWTYYPITAEIPSDPEISGIVARYSSQLDQRFKEVIGTAAVFLDGERGRIRYQETTLGNFVTDIMREHTSADIALLNGGALRASIDEGPITVEEVFTSMPYANDLVVVKLTGSELVQVLTRSTQGTKLQEDGGFLHVSGIKLTIKNRLPAEVMVGDTLLDAAATYSVAIPDFLASGGDSYSMLVNKTTYNTGLPLRELIVDTIRSKGTITAQIEGRIIRVE